MFKIKYEHINLEVSGQGKKMVNIEKEKGLLTILSPPLLQSPQ